MAHELDFNAETGVANMFAVKQTPWHREGIVLPEAPTYADAIRLAGLDYTVELRDAHFTAHTAYGDEYEKATDGFAVVRTDREECLALVGKKYAPIQNIDAMNVLEPLINEGFATIETGGVLRRGGDAWLLVRWNLDRMGDQVRAFGGKVQPYGLVAANHTGRRGVLLQDTPVVVVCANTLAQSEYAGSGIVVRHTATGTDRMVRAAEALWGGVGARYEALAAQWTKLQAETCSHRLFEKAVLDIIAPTDRLDPSSKLAGMVQDRLAAQRTSLTRLFNEGTGVDGSHSKWSAYMSATEALDHDPDKVFASRGSRAQQLLDGHLATKKRTVLSHLLRATA